MRNGRSECGLHVDKRVRTAHTYLLPSLLTHLHHDDNIRVICIDQLDVILIILSNSVLRTVFYFTFFMWVAQKWMRLKVHFFLISNFSGINNIKTISSKRSKCHLKKNTFYIQYVLWNALKIKTCSGYF